MEERFPFFWQLFTVSFFLVIRSGQAQFAPVSSYSVGNSAYPHSIALGDVNSDGQVDIVTANMATSTVGVLLGQSAGGFAPVSTYSIGPVGSIPIGVVLGDVNGDGRLDIVTANSGTDTVGVLLGQANGTFAAVTLYSAGSGSGPRGVALGDVTGDGQLDIVTANFGTGTVGVLPGQVGGSFTPVSTYATGVNSQPNSVALGDMNGDGRLDIVTTTTNVPVAINMVSVLKAQAGGGFAAASTYSTGTNSQPQRVALADVNGDGRLDIVTANQGTDTIGLLLGQSNGVFSPVVFYATGFNSNPVDVTFGDINGDGRLDLITANAANSTASMLLGQAGGFAGANAYSTGPSTQPVSVAVGDVNGDGRLDIVTANVVSSAAGVLLGTTAPLATVVPAALDHVTASVYPAPALGVATITLTVANLPPTIAHLEAVLLNAVGQSVRQFELEPSQGEAHATLLINGLASGLYVLRLQAVRQQEQEQEGKALLTYRFSL